VERTRAPDGDHPRDVAINYEQNSYHGCESQTQSGTYLDAEVMDDGSWNDAPMEFDRGDRTQRCAAKPVDGSGDRCSAWAATEHGFELQVTGNQCPMMRAISI
jgi:hypothetical protein